MKKTIAILQPGYMPWLGFFEMLDRADVFVLYDNVQFDKNGWRNRNRIKTSYQTSGEYWQWLTIPVKVHGKPLLKDVEITNDPRWIAKQLTAVRQNYQKAPHFNDYANWAFSPLWDNGDKLADITTALIKRLADLLGIPSEKLVRASEFDMQWPGGKTDKLVAICEHLEGTHYYATLASKDYIDAQRFARAEIVLEFQHYRHPVYRQQHGAFVPYMSVLDLLFNEGPRSLEIIREGGA